MLPLIQHEVVDKHKYITYEELVDMISLSESTPGSLAVNVATFVGYKKHGFWGAASATLGVIVPSFVIIAILSFFIEAFKENKIVSFAFYGIRIGVLSLIINAFMSIYKSFKKTPVNVILIILTFICVAVLKINAIIMLIFCAAAGIIRAAITRKESLKQ
mgnify:CR=1 FL=1